MPRGRAYWFDATSQTWIAVHNHAADALSTPWRYRLSRRDVAAALRSGATFMARRPATIKAVIERGYVRVRLMTDGRLIVQSALPAQAKAVLDVVKGMVDRHALKAQARCSLSDQGGATVFAGTIAGVRRLLQRMRDDHGAR